MKISKLKTIIKKFAVETKQALWILPPKPKEQQPLNQIGNLKLPLITPLEPQTFEVTKKYTVSKFDDSNSKNWQKIQVVKTEDNIPEIYNQMRQSRKAFILNEKTKLPLKTMNFQTTILQTSYKKSRIVMKEIIGLHFYDALSKLSTIEKKVAKFLKNSLEKHAIYEIEEKEFNIKNLYITGIILERKKRLKKLNYHAKGRAGIRKRDFYEFKIQLSEKPLNDLYKNMILGNSPPYLAFLLKDRLAHKKPDYKEIRELQTFLHFKGRNQQKLFFHRRCLSKWLDFQKQGFSMRLNVIKEKLLEEEASIFEDKYKEFLMYDQIQEEKRKVDRIELYEKNEGSLNA